MNPIPSKPRVLLTLLVGVLAVSTGAIFVRLADAHPLAVSAYRVGLAVLIILPWTARSTIQAWCRWPGVIRIRVMMAGFFLAVHFALWITSLSYTSVANSVVLVNTIPIWVGLLTPVITRERVPRALWLAIGFSAVGSLLITWQAHGQETSGRWGDLLALGGGLAAALYLLLGRSVREHVSNQSYITVCYGASAVVLWSVVFALHVPARGFTVSTWGALLALAVISQHLGHSTYNWVLKHLSAGIVAVTLLGEPVLSSLLAYLVFEERLTLLQGGGALLILVGIYLAAVPPSSRNADHPDR